jgi:seryl-tRNA synthetase
MDNNAYMNALRKQRELARKIERFRHARGSAGNNNERTRLNNKIRTLISAMHPLEEQLHIIRPRVQENKLKKRSYLLSVQNMARRAIKKRRNAHAQRLAVRRSSVFGAHHTLPRRYVPVPVFSVRRPVKKRPVTRRVTSITRYFS